MISRNKLFGDVLMALFIAYISFYLFIQGNKALAIMVFLLAIFWSIMRNKNG